MDETTLHSTDEYQDSEWSGPPLRLVRRQITPDGPEHMMVVTNAKPDEVVYRRLDSVVLTDIAATQNWLMSQSRELQSEVAELTAGVDRLQQDVCAGRGRESSYLGEIDKLQQQLKSLHSEKAQELLRLADRKSSAKKRQEKSRLASRRKPRNALRTSSLVARCSDVLL